MYKKILLAVDGSPTSEQALREAAKIAPDGATLRVVTVVVNPVVVFPSLYGMGYDAGIVRNAALESGRAALESAVQQLEELAITAEGRLIDLTETVSTNVAAAIQDEAASWPADLVVVGTHGHSGVKRFFLGSVAEQLVRCSSTPVLLIRGQESRDSSQGFSEWDEKVIGD